MATLSDKFKITIRVADLPDFTLTVRREEEEAYRQAVKEINRLWTEFTRKMPDMNTSGILAIAAVKFAKQLYDTVSDIKKINEEDQNRQLEINTMLSNFESKIDSIILDIDQEHKI